MSAALTFGLARHLRFSVPDVFSRGLLASALVPSFLAAPRLGTWTLPSLLDVLADLFPPILHAVPKKKVSHSRKAMRSANKGLKDKFNIVHCPACGAPKLAHHLCSSCFSDINRRWKREAKAESKALENESV